MFSNFRFIQNFITYLNHTYKTDEKQQLYLHRIYSDTVKPKNSNFDFSKYSIVQNKFGIHWIQRIGPIHDLF